MKKIFTTQEIFGETEPEIIEKGTTMLKEPKAGVEQRMRGIGEIPTFKTPKPLSLENLTLVSLPPDTELDILNDKIEGTYTEYLKLQKKIEEFDTSLSEIPNAMKPTIVANYNNAVNKFNSLIGELQTDIAKRDQIISIQEETQKKQDFIKQKRLAEAETEPQYATLAASGIGWQQRMAGMGELPGRVRVPISKSDESDIKDVWDSFVLGGSKIWQQTKDYFKSALPNMIFAPIEENHIGKVNITEEQRKKINAHNKEKLEYYDKAYQKSQANYYKWIADNPQLQPRKEWEGGVVESVKKNPEVLLDPAYWAYVAAGSASMTIGAMGTTLAVTAITQNPLIGMAAGVIAMTPMQTQDLYEDLIANGATPEQAGKLAAPVGALIASVEVMGDLPILANLSKPFKKMLFGNIRNTVMARVAQFISKSKVTNFATIEFSETLEEVVQAALQDACVKTVNENRKILGDLKEILAATPIATVPFAMLGINVDVNTQDRIKNEIKAKVSKLINDRNLRDAIRIQLEEQGIIPREPAVVTEAYKVEPKEPTIPEEFKNNNPQIFEYKENKFLTTDNELGMGKVKDIRVFDGEMWKFVESKRGFGNFAKKDLDRITENLKIEPKEPTIPKALEAKREMLREHGVKEELLTDEFVKKAKITELPKADVTSEIVSEGLIEELEEKWGREVKLTKKEVLKKVEEKIAPKEELKAKDIQAEQQRYATLKRELGEDADFQIEFIQRQIDSGTSRHDIINGLIQRQIDEGVEPLGNESVQWLSDKIDEKATLKDFEWKAEAVTEKLKPEVKPEVKVEEPPKVPPISPKEVALEEEPEFHKDVKIKDVYTIGEVTPVKKVKGKVREVTGQTKKDKILISELDILDLVLKGQEKAAKKAFSEGKKEGIFAQKEHFEEVVARAKERKAQKEYINKLIKDINKLPTENVAIDYKDKIEAIKDMFDLKKRQQKTLHAREETVKFIEREMEKGDTVLNIPQKVLDIIKTIPLNDMTIAQLETVHDSIIHLAKIGKLKGKMIKVQKGKEIKELARDLVATLYENKVNKISQEKYGLDFNELNRTQKQDIIEDFQKKTRNIKQEIKDISSLKQKVKDPWNHYWINTTLDESLFEKMDGEERGLWHEIFYNTINNCTNTELLNTFEKIEKIRNLFNDNKIDIDKFLQERTGDLMLTHSQRAGLYLCSLDEDALRHVQNAGVIIKKGLEPYQFTDKDIKDVSDSLTKEEKAVVKFYQEYQLTQEKELDEFDVRVRGVHLKGVKNRFAIQVLGEDLYNSVSVELEHNPLTRRAYMEEGFRKERTHRAENVIMLDCITNMLRDIAKVEHYKAYKEAEMDINNLLSNPELKKAILGNPKYGRVAYDNITQWFKDSVKAKQNKILSTSDKTLMFLRTSAFISMLGFNVLSGTKQLISLSNAVGLVGLPAVLSGIEQVSLHYNETKQFVFKADPQARARKGIIDKVMQEWMETTEAKQILKNQTGDIRMKTLFLIRILDEYAVLSVWKGTYDSVINTQKIGGKKIKFTDAADLERQAIEYAAYVIRKTQPSALMKDLPQWFRDGTVAKMFSLFQNQINKNQNFLRDTFRQYKAGKISTGTLAWRTLWNLFLPAILIGTITRGRPPEDWKEYARDIATYYAGGWFFVGSIVVNMMQGYGGWMPAPLSFGEEFVKAYTYKTRAAQLKHAISGACKVIGLPYNQPYRTIEGVDDWIQGETEDIRRLIWTEYVLGKEEEKPSYEKTKKKKIKKTKKTKKKKKI